MANASPVKTVVTSTTGPGQTVTSQTFTDVNDFEVDFNRNVIKITRDGAGGIIYYDYSAIATLTWTITAGTATITIST